MRILLITHSDLNSNNGGARVSKLILQALETIGKTKLTVISPTNFQSQKKTKNLTINRRTKLQFILDFIRLRFHKFHNAFLKEFKTGYDIVIFDGSLIGGDLARAAKGLSRTISIHHNYDQHYYRDIKSHLTFFGIFSYHIKVCQRRCLENSDTNICLTRVDQIALRRLSPLSDVRTWGTFLDKVPSIHETLMERKQSGENRAVITGELSNLQNQFSITNFIIKIWAPLNLDTRLVVIGRNPTSKLRKVLREKEIQLIEDPKNYLEEISRASIYLAVNDIGSGVKIKLHDPLSLGMPVLAHRVSAIGYEELGNEPWFKTYSDIREFQQSFELLQASSFDRNQIRNVFEEKFSMAEGIKSLLKILNL